MSVPEISSPPVHAQRSGDSAPPDPLRAVREALAAAGYLRGSRDGRESDPTTAAVRAFQIVHGLPADGVPGPATTAVLFGQHLRLSVSVAGVLHSPGPVTATGLLRLVLAHHDEYGGGRAASLALKPDADGVERTVPEWLGQIRSLLIPDAVPELHGRQVVVGLTLISVALAYRLDADGFRTAVIDEIREPLDTLLSPAGLALHRSLDPAEQFGRLSSSAVTALQVGEGHRLAEVSDRLHSEHIVLGLYAKADGPTRTLCDAVQLGEQELYGALEKAAGRALPRSPVETAPLDTLPASSRHVMQALAEAVRLADAHRAWEVGTRYVLYGVLAVPGCEVANELAAARLRVADVVAWIVRMNTRQIAAAAADTVPEPGGGRVQQADRLDTASDVEMLASVLLARNTPLPLAIGLFGDWGSGKSFFMSLMHEFTEQFADRSRAGEQPEATLFCSNVKQVRFNAWHYADTNLWASLAYHLFEGLAGSPTVDPVVALQEKHTAAQLARRRREGLERETRALEEQTSRRVAVMSDYAGAALQELRENKELRDDLNRLAGGEEVEHAHTETVLDALASVEGVAGRARTAFALLTRQVRERGGTVLAIGIPAAVLVVAAVVFGLPRVYPLALTVLGVIAALTPAARAMFAILGHARQRRADREATLQEKRRELAEAEAEELRAEHSLRTAEQGVDDDGQRLLEFVRERSSSSDYKTELGLISRVRGDFERLFKLLSPGATGKGTGIDRIVLYIDDLDRCPYGKVVEVLQAVHLLLAFELFVVVVGVDSRWLEKSLQVHYRDMLDAPENYLEKIFQIPFRLRPMGLTGYRRLVHDMTDPLSVPSPRGATTDRPAEIPRPERTKGGDGGEAEAANGNPRLVATTAPAEPPPSVERPGRGIDVATLRLSDAERDLLGRLGAIIDTPRSAERMVNIYRMLRVSVPRHELPVFIEATTGEYRAVALLLAVLVGRPLDVGPVFTAILGAPSEANVWRVLHRFPAVVDDLESVQSTRRMAELTAGACARWAPQVSRFSFRLQGVVQVPV